MNPGAGWVIQTSLLLSVAMHLSLMSVDTAAASFPRTPAGTRWPIRLVIPSTPNSGPAVAAGAARAAVFISEFSLPHPKPDTPGEGRGGREGEVVQFPSILISLTSLPY